MSASKSPEQPHRVVVYGLDRRGHQLPSKPVLVAQDIEVEFVPYGSPIRLDRGSGAIITYPLFETYDRVNGPFGGLLVETDTTRMLDRYREVMNVVKDGGWVCCLVGHIIDSAYWGNRTVDHSSSDLVKRLMNDLAIKRHLLSSERPAQAIVDEFAPYLREWGVASTGLEARYKEVEAKPIARIGDTPVGLAIGDRVFFLPFHSARTDEASAEQLVRTLVPAIESYRRRHSTELPVWIDEFQFTRETVIQTELEAILSNAASLQTELLHWHQYKGVLVRWGEPLRHAVAEILTSFFKLSVEGEDSGIEDLLIVDESKKPIAVVEVKGSNGGVKREHINQVDSHRERDGLPESFPGLLVINDFMKTQGWTERAAKEVAPEHISHASRLNVLIIRTCQLLRAMDVLESSPDRGTRLLEYLRQGGGELRVSDENEIIVKTS